MFQKPTQVAHLALFLQAENVFEQAGQALKRGVDSVLDAGGKLTNLFSISNFAPWDVKNVAVSTLSCDCGQVTDIVLKKGTCHTGSGLVSAGLSLLAR